MALSQQPKCTFSWYNSLKQYENQIHIVEYRKFNNYEPIRQSLKQQPQHVIWTDPNYESKVVSVEKWPELNAHWCDCMNEKIIIDNVLQFKKNDNCCHPLIINKSSQHYSLSDDASVSFVRDPKQQVIPPESKSDEWSFSLSEKPYESFKDFVHEYNAAVEGTNSWLPYIPRSQRDAMNKSDYLMLMAQLLQSLTDMSHNGSNQHHVCGCILHHFFF